MALLNTQGSKQSRIAMAEPFVLTLLTGRSDNVINQTCIRINYSVNVFQLIPLVTARNQIWPLQENLMHMSCNLLLEIFFNKYYILKETSDAKSERGPSNWNWPLVCVFALC